MMQLPQCCAAQTCACGVVGCEGGQVKLVALAMQAVRVAVCVCGQRPGDGAGCGSIGMRACLNVLTGSKSSPMQTGQRHPVDVLSRAVKGGLVQIWW